MRFCEVEIGRGCRGVVYKLLFFDINFLDRVLKIGRDCKIIFFFFLSFFWWILVRNDFKMCFLLVENFFFMSLGNSLFVIFEEEIFNVFKIFVVEGG